MLAHSAHFGCFIPFVSVGLRISAAAMPWITKVLFITCLKALYSMYKDKNSPFPLQLLNGSISAQNLSLLYRAVEAVVVATLATCSLAMAHPSG